MNGTILTSPTEKLIISKTLAEVESDPNTKVTKVACQSAKTNAGKRTISIDLQTMGMLETWRERQQLELKILGIRSTNKHQLVFPNKKNKFCRPGQVNDWFNYDLCKVQTKKANNDSRIQKNTCLIMSNG